MNVELTAGLIVTVERDNVIEKIAIQPQGGLQELLNVTTMFTEAVVNCRPIDQIGHPMFGKTPIGVELSIMRKEFEHGIIEPAPRDALQQNPGKQTDSGVRQGNRAPAGNQEGNQDTGKGGKVGEVTDIRSHKNHTGGGHNSGGEQA